VTHPGDEQLVESFVERGQRDLAVMTERQLDEGWERLQGSEAGAPRPQRRPFWTGARFATALAAAAVAVVVYRFAIPRPDSSLRYSLEGAVASTTNKITSAANAGSRLRFTDDSRIDLAALTTVSVDAVAESGAQVALVDGVIDVFVKPRPHSAWTFTAGPFQVKVKGTSFRLTYSRTLQRMGLHMTSGLVEVVDPRGRATAVSAGQSVEMTADQAVTEDLRAQAPPAPPFAPVGSADLPEAQDKTPARAARANPLAEPAHRRLSVHAKDDRAEPTPDHPTSPTPAWSKLITQGRYAEVIDEAQRRGLDATLAQATAAELWSLADAARYTKRHELAREVLLAMRARFAGTEYARDASFFLGRLGEAVPGQPEAALGWYDTYLREAPRGLYASEALGREMTLLTAKDRGKASKLAKQYLERFPRGSQAELARSLLETGND
jgi:TolA-binding protein